MKYTLSNITASCLIFQNRDDDDDDDVLYICIDLEVLIWKYRSICRESK